MFALTINWLNISSALALKDRPQWEPVTMDREEWYSPAKPVTVLQGQQAKVQLALEPVRGQLGERIPQPLAQQTKQHL